MLQWGWEWGAAGEGAAERLEKFHAAWTMYDGSYFYRLMQAGGKFDAMFDASCPVRSPFGLLVVLCGILLAVHLVRCRGEAGGSRCLAFLLLGALLITSGVFLLPLATRIHHHLAVYPFPQLIVAAAILLLWRKSPAQPLAKWGLRAAALAMAVAVIGGHLVALRQTQSLIARTGGRGHFSDSIAEFCKDIKDQQGLAVVSLDWGFNEPLHYLCRNKKLFEPIWSDQTPPASSKAATSSIRPNTRSFRRDWRIIASCSGPIPAECRSDPTRTARAMRCFMPFVCRSDPAARKGLRATGSASACPRQSVSRQKRRFRPDPDHLKPLRRLL
jgi:hypothetical protein